MKKKSKIFCAGGNRCRNASLFIPLKTLFSQAGLPGRKNAGETTWIKSKSLRQLRCSLRRRSTDFIPLSGCPADLEGLENVFLSHIRFYGSPYHGIGKAGTGAFFSRSMAGHPRGFSDFSFDFSPFQYYIPPENQIKYRRQKYETDHPFFRTMGGYAPGYLHEKSRFLGL